MQMTSRWMCSAVITLVSLFAQALGAESARATLVEVWCGGDDGLTLRLRDALENAFKSSPAFALSTGKKPGTLIVTIPTRRVGCSASKPRVAGHHCWLIFRFTL